MKKFIHKYKFLAVALPLVFSASCTKDFVEDNRDPNAITDVSNAEFPYLFNKALASVFVNASYYETTQNYFADIYAQYYAKSVSTERYMLNSEYARRMYLVSYVHVGAQLKSILDSADPNSGEYALANVIWVYNFGRLTDVMGPIPYSEALESDGSNGVKYDKMSDIYADFFVRLTKSVDALKKLNTSTSLFGGQDNLYGGNVGLWIKFANTLKLRLALRVSKIDPSLAKKMGEEAYASGVLTANTENASLLKSLLGNDFNGMASISGWYATSMSSTMKSYLQGYQDPRLSIFFQKNFTTKEFSSRRNGMPATDINVMVNNVSVNANTLQSNVGPYWITYNANGVATQNFTNRQHVLSSAEAYFLRAEGALNGWSMGGTAQALYEDGIKQSLNQWGVVDAAQVSAYTNSENLPTAPGDYYKSAAVSSTPIKWATSESMQRKQIGTQKWLAIFPDGWEAWAEFRRTGYPDMYNLITSENADLPVGTFIKRLTYPEAEYTANAQGVKEGVSYLGGTDKASVRLWWDVD
ncbi:SusD/RagB family nutrient-binding outer membrane lipoprotein [Sphingobacterium sp. DK4209]|uniref:SusD/RagB family nutrient-binding outer membrane lipoprotein n=1 Tax=Sphingobacterium zhuxiongii TaxID=2662364 RepID=A0A5Q0QHP5_9SPHI|nr:MULTISPECIES: SusD/RagB family nutrient-binding outer membrane lipoprotein [unclassified Sphingobacterium]MVZ64631.1 SusD/RagB family nutrient-binding outer membrane lipoprotein [Sphingobacterium sp. DK4209]QGA26970.1 SusD/RagB family nutrient-binding outer membrane lipoprotein [Sphingobacterium sp. dk4302]